MQRNFNKNHRDNKVLSYLSAMTAWMFVGIWLLYSGTVFWKFNQQNSGKANICSRRTLNSLK